MATSSVSQSALLNTYYTSKHAAVSLNSELQLVLCTATATYIPKAEFINMFEKAAELVKHEKLSKCIYDERKLIAFHMPSMEWLYLVWKESMYKYGLSTYRKLLPDDKQFEHLVNVARRKIARENPWFDFERFDIRYCKSLEEAIES